VGSGSLRNVLKSDGGHDGRQYENHRCDAYEPTTSVRLPLENRRDRSPKYKTYPHGNSTELARCIWDMLATAGTQLCG
jgi:hypothetical protein